MTLILSRREMGSKMVRRATRSFTEVYADEGSGADTSLNDLEASFGWTLSSDLRLKTPYPCSGAIT